jgi:methylmalonyl-CoA mutase
MAETIYHTFPPVSFDQWMQKVRTDLKGREPETLRWALEEGLNFDAFYPADGSTTSALAQAITSYLATSSHPGWKVFQSFYGSSIHDLREFLATLPDHGLDGIIVSLDPESSEASPEGLKALAQLASDHSLKLRFRSAATGLISYAVMDEWARDRSLLATFFSANLDPFRPFITQGGFSGGHAIAFDSCAAFFQFASTRPWVGKLTLSASPLHDAGAGIVLESACLLSMVVDLVDQMQQRGISAHDTFQKLCVEVSVSSDFFPEIARLRALRYLMSRLMTRYDGNHPDSYREISTSAHQQISKLAHHPITIHAIASHREQSQLDYNVNMLRATTQAMSAIMGGCDSLTIPAYNHSFAPTDPFGARIAKNIQLLLRDESHLGRVADPAAGSGFVDALSASLAESIWSQFLDIESKGGFIVAIRGGWVQTQVNAQAQMRASVLATRKQVRIGVNQFPQPHEAITEYVKGASLPSSDSFSAIAAQPWVEWIQQLGSKIGVNQPLALFSPSPVTEAEALPPFRTSIPFEKIREDAEALFSNGIRRKVFLFEFGDLTMRKARATFAQNLFGLAGLSILSATQPDNIEATLKEVVQLQPDLVVFCSSDEEYLSIASQLSGSLPEKSRLILAGKSVDTSAFLRQPDDFIHARMDVIEFLRALLNHWEGGN